MDMQSRVRRLYRWADQAAYTAAITALGWQNGPPPGVDLLPIGTVSGFWYVDALFTDVPPSAWDGQFVPDLSAPATITRFSRPRPPKGTLHVRDFGVIADGDPAGNDSAALQRAIDMAAATGYDLNLGTGTIVLKPTLTGFTWPPTAPVPVYRGIKLPKGRLHVFGEGARIVVTGSTPNPSRTYMFATDIETADGATQDHRWEKVILDFDDNYAINVQGTYGFGYFSVTDLVFQGLRLANSGTATNRGWGMSLLNARHVRFHDLRSSRLSQTISARYAYDWEMDGIQITDFGEAIDFDGDAEGILASDFTFLRGDQAIDLNSVRSLTLDGMRLDQVNNIIAIADKHTTPPTYLQYLAAETIHDPPDFPTSAKIYISNVLATRCILPGFGAEIPVRIGTGRDGSEGVTRAGRPPPDDICLKKWTIEGGRYNYIQEGTNIVLEDWILRNGIADGPNGGNCAFLLRSSTGGTVDTPEAIADADLEVTIRNMKIENSPGGGLYVDRPRILRIDGLTVDGYNLDGRTDAYGLTLSSLNARAAVIDLRSVNISGGLSPLADLYMNDTGAMGRARVTLSAVKLSAAVPIDIAGTPSSMQNVFPRERMRVLGVSSVTKATDPHLIYTAVGQPTSFVFAWLTFKDAVAAAPVNFTTWNMSHLNGATGAITGINSGSLNAGYTAGQTIPLAPDITKTPWELADGDSIILDFRRAAGGTGNVIGDVTITTSVIPH